VFHEFIEFVLDELLTDPSEKLDLDSRAELSEEYKNDPLVYERITAPLLPIERALRHHGYKFESFGCWLDRQNIEYPCASNDDVYEYLNGLRSSGVYDELLLQSVREVFFLLFANRHVLLLFNEMIAKLIQDTCVDEVPEEYLGNFARSGVLKRVYMPEWVRRAVFFRDRGMCVSCNSDLSGMLKICSEDNFDHIVPLALGGLNDVTNIQLLCATCNSKKGDRFIITSSLYEDWYVLPKNSDY
jgi:hypothetical protein